MDNFVKGERVYIDPDSQLLAGKPGKVVEERESDHIPAIIKFSPNGFCIGPPPYIVVSSYSPHSWVVAINKSYIKKDRRTHA